MQSEIEILKYYLWYPSPKIEILRNKFDPKIWITYRQQKKPIKMLLRNCKRPKIMEEYTVFMDWKTHYC